MENETIEQDYTMQLNYIYNKLNYITESIDLKSGDNTQILNEISKNTKTIPLLAIIIVTMTLLKFLFKN